MGGGGVALRPNKKKKKAHPKEGKTKHKISSSLYPQQCEKITFVGADTLFLPSPTCYATGGISDFPLLSCSMTREGVGDPWYKTWLACLMLSSECRSLRLS